METVSGEEKKRGIIPLRDLVRKWAQAKIQTILPEGHVLEGIGEDFGDGLGEGYEEEFEAEQDEENRTCL